MRQKRRNFTAAFKTKVVLEALKERETIQQLAVKSRFTPTKSQPGRSSFCPMLVPLSIKVTPMRSSNKPGPNSMNSTTNWSDEGGDRLVKKKLL